MRTFKYFDHIGYAMLTSRQYFFFKLPQINFNNKNNISECSQNAKKNNSLPMFTKCREHFFLNIHKMQRKHFYANCRCSQTVCQTAQQGGARQRGKEAKLNKRNLTFTISNFSIYTIFVITFGQYNWLMKDM